MQEPVRLTPSEFAELYKTHSNKELAERFDVSPQTIVNWSKKLNIPLKKRPKVVFVEEKNNG
jgi:DNA-binding XRE family transcriptional regulator